VSVAAPLARLLAVAAALAGCKNGSDAGVCGDDPTPPGTVAACPPECSGGCQDGVCTIDCSNHACTSVITCPSDYACVVACDGLDACDTASITCPADYPCTVRCISGVDACGDLAIHCQGGACAIECAEATCIGAALLCGGGPCTATCSASSTPTVECGESCACTPCT
jgi:hypothetical protein